MERSNGVFQIGNALKQKIADLGAHPIFLEVGGKLLPLRHTAQGLVHPHKHGLTVQDGAVRGGTVDKDDVGVPRDGGDLPSGILAGQVDDQRSAPAETS